MAGGYSCSPPPATLAPISLELALRLERGHLEVRRAVLAAVVPKQHDRLPWPDDVARSIRAGDRGCIPARIRVARFRVRRRDLRLVDRSERSGEGAAAVRLREEKVELVARR